MLRKIAHKKEVHTAELLQIKQVSCESPVPTFSAYFTLSHSKKLIKGSSPLASTRERGDKNHKQKKKKKTNRMILSGFYGRSLTLV